MHQVTFDRISLALQVALSTKLLRDCDVSAVLDPIVDRVVLRFHSTVFGKQKTVTVSHSADWWQAVRERWFPAWWLTRWPVRHTTHVIDARVLLPNLVLPATEKYAVLYQAEVRDAR